MKISTRGRYAVEAVVDLAMHSETDHESLKNIAFRRKISENYLEQIFINLRKTGIVKSIRGAKGGYVMAKSPKDTTCGEIIRASERRFTPVKCIDKRKNEAECGRYNKCVTRILWEKIRDEVNIAADEVSIQCLIDAHRSNLEGKQTDYSI